MERNLIELARPAHRVYLAQASTLPLPRFAHHLSTVSLVVGGDQVLSGRAVLGVEPWLSLLDLKTHKPRTSVSELSDPSMFQPDGKILSQQMPSNVRRDMPIRGQCGRVVSSVVSKLEVAHRFLYTFSLQ